MSTILKVVGVIALIVCSFFLRMHVLQKLWSYIVLPLGAQPLSFWSAFGVSMIVSWLAADYSKRDEIKGLDEAARRVLTAILGSLVTWGLGYLIFA